MPLFSFMENVQTEPVVWFGGEVKALDDTGRIGGYLVRFSTDKDPDLAGDFFTAKTDFGAQKSSPVLYHHGLDKALKSRIIGTGELKTDDVGVWLEGQLALRDEYEQAIFDMAKQGKLGWSSGTASHLVEREAVGKSWWIKSWPLGLDASLTPTPCEPRTKAVPLKTYLDSLKATEADTTEEPAGSVGSAVAPAGEVSANTETIQPTKTMENNTQPQAQEQKPAPAPAPVKAQEPTTVITLSREEYDALKTQAATPSRIVEAKYDTTTTGAPTFVKQLGDTYDQAFAAFIKRGDIGGVKSYMTGDMSVSIKASNDTDMNVGTAADGGNAVPTGHFQQIIARRDDLMLASKLGVRNIPGKGTTVNVPLDGEADVSFVATNEAAAFDRDAPALGTTAMTLVKYSKDIQLSYELLQDEDSQLLSFLSDWVGRAMAGKHNELLITAAASGTATGAFAATGAIAAGELEPMVYNNDLSNYLDDSSSVAWITRASTHGSVISLLGNNRLYESQNASSTGSKGQDARGTLLGYPVHYSASVAAPAASAKSIFFGNWFYMGVRNVPEFEVLRDPYSKASNGQVVFHYYFRTVYKVLQAEAIGYGAQAAS